MKKQVSFTEPSKEKEEQEEKKSSKLFGLEKKCKHCENKPKNLCNSCGSGVCEKCCISSEREKLVDDNVVGTFLVFHCYPCLEDPPNRC